MSFGTYAALATGVTLALTSSAHCAVMCGPLALATRVRGGARASASYLAGRLVGYAALGALAGSVGHVLLTSPLARTVELVLSALLVVLLIAAGYRQLEGATRGPALIALGTKPRTSRVGRILAQVADEPLLLGLATALLPCGVLLLAVTAAARLGTAWLGAVALGSFSVASAAVLLATSLIGGRVLRRVSVRRALGALLIVAAGITAARALPLVSAAAPTCPLHAAREAR